MNSHDYPAAVSSVSAPPASARDSAGAPDRGQPSSPPPDGAGTDETLDGQFVLRPHQLGESTGN